MKMLSKSQFTAIGPGEIWKLYSNVNGIFRGVGIQNRRSC